jgi:hypothetical protein
MIRPKGLTLSELYGSLVEDAPIQVEVEIILEVDAVTPVKSQRLSL